MKKVSYKLKIIITIMIAFSLMVSYVNVTSADKKIETVAYKKTPVGAHGRLNVKGTKLVDQYGKEIQIQGVSTHGINWDVGEPYVNYNSFKILRDKWGVNCIRVAMYTEDYNGYCVTDDTNRKKLLKTIDLAVGNAKKLGMYVIIDWHVLNDQNPLKHKDEAKQFFKKMAKKYGKNKNVMFEICNEPNGTTTWNDIKKYANPIIKVIRKYAKKSIIIVGTPTWSQDVDVASMSPVKNGKNIMYAIHFYAATHQDYYMNKVKKAISNKLPVICTEFSGCEANGNGNINKSSLYKWLNYLKSNGIGYCCWSLSNKNESASLLKADCYKKYGYTYSDLSKMGKLLVEFYKK